jgi:DNA-directed RNA polymerase specialized sigma24 family protein
MDFKSLSAAEILRLLKERGNRLFYLCIATGLLEQDARDVCESAIEKAFQNWSQIRAEHGMESLDDWLKTTAFRMHWRSSKKKQRLPTISLHDVLSPADAEEAQILETKLANSDSWEADVSRNEKIALVNEVLEKMPACCELKPGLQVDSCDGNCGVLFTRYMREERVLTIAELSVEFDLRPGTIYDRIRDCKIHFKKLWKQMS